MKSFGAKNPTHARLSFLIIGALLVLPQTASAAPVRADFNGDGRADLAVGAPADSVHGRDFAGAVNVIYGSSRGLRGLGNQQFTQDTPGVAAFASRGDRFGAALAAGDLNGDGRSDLLIGVPGEDASGRANAGVVNVLYGSPRGLTTAGNRFFSQDSPGVPGGAERNENFGRSLTVGDFDGDGFGDAAIGAPDESVGRVTAAGAVNVIYGSAAGLDPARSQIWQQGTPGIIANPGEFNRFGFALAAGDVDGDGDDELSAGVPGESIRGRVGAGAVNVIYGSPTGLSSAPDQLFSQGRSGAAGSPDRGDNFGRAVAMGDFNADGRMDLVAGAPFEDIPSARETGAVSVFYGTPSGLRSRGNQILTQNSRGIPGGAERGDRFGSSLAAGDMSRNPAWDLAIGVSYESVDGRPGAGAVNVLYGGRRGLRSDRSAELWHQNTRGIKGGAERFDRFGERVLVADVDGDGDGELLVGVPAEGVNGRRDAGAVNVIYGSVTGLRADPDRIWHQGTDGILGAVGPDRFGQALGGGPLGAG